MFGNPWQLMYCKLLRIYFSKGKTQFIYYPIRGLCFWCPYSQKQQKHQNDACLISNNALVSHQKREANACSIAQPEWIELYIETGLTEENKEQHESRENLQ